MSATASELATRALASQNSTPIGESPLDSPSPTKVDRRKLPELLDGILEVLDRYVILPSDHARIVVALFVAHTYAFEGAHATPYLMVLSPEKRSGKTRLLEILAVLCARSWMVAGASEAALYRKISQDKPTLLLDEIDATFGVNSERTEGVRQALNAGNRRGATVPRCIGKQMNEVKDFEVFCPKVLAGIDIQSKIPETVRDRSIEIRMVRRTGSERVERYRHRRLLDEVESLSTELEAWANGAVDALLAVEPLLPDELDDRKAEAAEPLFAIGDMAGSDWATKARAAVIALASARTDDSDGLGTLLLVKLREIFGDRSGVATAEICEAVNTDETIPFGGFGGGSGIDSRSLSRLLKPYGIRPTSVRIGERTPKGYKREQLEDAWARYTPRTESAQQAKHPQHADSVADAIPHTNGVVADVADVADFPDRSSDVADISVSEATDAEQATAERVLETYGGDAS